jgi:hypothetical protein
MRTDRLLKLADLLDRVPEKHFDMTTWGSLNSPMDDDIKCATAACALGWATAIPEFAAAGLGLVAYEGHTNAIVKYQGHEDIYAGQVFFGLDYEDAESLFTDGAEDAKGKAREIRELVRHYRRSHK